MEGLSRSVPQLTGTEERQSGWGLPQVFPMPELYTSLLLYCSHPTLAQGLYRTLGLATWHSVGTLLREMSMDKHSESLVRLDSREFQENGQVKREVNCGTVKQHIPLGTPTI